MSESVKTKVSNFKDTTAGKAVIYGGGLVAAIIVILITIAAIGRLMQASGQHNQDSSGESGTSGGVPSLGWFTGTPKQEEPEAPYGPYVGSKYDFGWVDGNDKKGLQTVGLNVYYVKNGVYIEAHKDLMWKAGIEQEFIAAGWVHDSASGKGLPFWGVAMHIFDADHTAIATAKGVTTKDGNFQFTFKLKPTSAGTYRCRAAAGDAANEQAINFWLPASYKLEN